MITLQLIKNYQGHKIGEIITVDNNIAHGLVDSGVATRNAGKVIEEKQTVVMTPQKKRGRGYKIK